MDRENLLELRYCTATHKGTLHASCQKNLMPKSKYALFRTHGNSQCDSIVAVTMSGKEALKDLTAALEKGIAAIDQEQPTNTEEVSNKQIRKKFLERFKHFAIEQHSGTFRALAFKEPLAYASIIDYLVHGNNKYDKATQVLEEHVDCLVYMRNVYRDALAWKTTRTK